MNGKESLETEFDKENCPDHCYAESIELPAEERIKNLHNAKKFAVDIGGSLAKVAYLPEASRIGARHYCRDGSSIGPRNGCDCVATADEVGKPPIFTVQEEQKRVAKLHFIKFESIESCVEFIKENIFEHRSETEDESMNITGGGAFKYSNLLSSKLGVKVDKLDEMECLIKGCNFLLKNIPNECFTFQKGDDLKKPIYTDKPIYDSRSLFPYLLVTIGTGVSMVKVDSESQYETLGGTRTGGGTFLGLGSLLTGAKGFDELLHLAMNGHHNNVNLQLEDIYGGDYSMLGLPGYITASCFGKVARMSRENKEGSAFNSCDLVKSLLHMICNDIVQISTLFARIYGLKRIFFGGNFINGHPLTMHFLSLAVKTFSRGRLEALFLRHEGYLGAVGAFVTGAMENAPTMNGLVSWHEKGEDHSLPSALCDLDKC